jgi:hypothetical protein
MAGGDLKFLYFDITVGAAPSNNDIWNVGKLPKGARIVDAMLQFPDMGSAGTLALGIDGGTNSLETADDDAFITAVDANTAADAASMKQQMEAGGANAGWMKQLADEVIVQVKTPTAFTVTSGTIKGYVMYATA